ncbi:DHA2 family efflux MFS transporter permease subunit [Nonomuraea polychroma]|uniref:DHA2 family efflux MFS transporter permease subunit n=1 Tax=Nonomuraea polychroma TaxID=46176 RepID=UPI003D8A201E
MTVMDHAAPVRAPGLAVTALFTAMFAVMLNVSIINVALTAIGTDLQVGMSGLQWVVNAFTLVFAMLLLPGGVVGDRFGLRSAFLLSLVLFTAGSLVCTLAPNLAVLLAGRVLQGAAGGLLLPASLALIAVLFPDPARRARFIAVWSSLNGLAVAVGPVLGGWLTDAFGWPAIFAVSVPIGLAALAVAAATLRLPAIPAQGGRIDVAGVILSLVWVGALTYALTEGPTRGWGSPLVVALLAGAAVALAAFVWVERGETRMLPLSLFRNFTFSGANVGAFAVGFAPFAAFVFFSLYLQRVLGFSALSTGVALLPAAGVMALTSPLAGALVARRGVRLPLSGGLAVAASGLLGAGLVDGYPLLAVMLAVFGFGLGLTLTPVNAAALASVPRQRAGVASAAVNTTRQVGMVLGVAVLGAVLSSVPGPDGFRSVFVVAALVAGLAAALTAVFIRPARD